MTRGKWATNMLQGFDFMQTNVEKHFSSSTLSTIYTMANLVNFTYFGNCGLIFKTLSLGATF